MYISPLASKTEKKVLFFWSAQENSCTVGFVFVVLLSSFITWCEDLKNTNRKETYDCCMRLIVVILTGNSEYNLGLAVTSFPTGWAEKMNNIPCCSDEMTVASQ